MLATAVCDAERRFTFWDFIVLPTAHDSQAWALRRGGRAPRNSKMAGLSRALTGTAQLMVMQQGRAPRGCVSLKRSRRLVLCAQTQRGRECGASNGIYRPPLEVP